MTSALVFAHFFSLAIWIGGLIILLGVVTPTLARMLSDELAAAVGEQVLRSYHLIAGACAVTAAGSLVLLLLRTASAPHAWTRLALLLGMSILTGIGAGIVQPRIDALRRSLPDFDPEGRVEEQVRQIGLLQKMSAQLDGLVLLLGLITLWLAVGGPAAIG